MASERSAVRHLILTTQKGLAPAPFPPRRDIDFAHAVSAPPSELTLFHDVLWTRQDRISCFVARIGGGPRGRLGAHVLRALLRAALAVHPAGRALDLSLQAFQEAGLEVPVDAAVASLSSTTGEATFGAFGAGAAVHLASAGGWSAVAAPAGNAAHLSAGDRCRLSVGGSPPGTDGETDVAALARETVAGRLDAAAVVIGLHALSEGRGRVFVLSNDVAEIGPVLSEIEEHLVDRGVRREALAGLDVALDELLTNVVLYAYRDGQTHEVAVELRLDGDTLSIEIRDDGTPFDPTEAAPPPDLDAPLDDRPIGGLGLHFVRTVFDTLEYRRVGGWNVLTLSKTLGAARSQDGPGHASGIGHAVRTIL